MGLYGRARRGQSTFCGLPDRSAGNSLTVIFEGRVPSPVPDTRVSPHWRFLLNSFFSSRTRASVDAFFFRKKKSLTRGYESRKSMTVCLLRIVVFFVSFFRVEKELLARNNMYRAEMLEIISRGTYI